MTDTGRWRLAGVMSSDLAKARLRDGEGQGPLRIKKSKGRWGWTRGSRQGRVRWSTGGGKSNLGAC